MAGMRQVIAENMMASLHNAAQLTVFVEFDATAMVRFRDKIRKKYAGDAASPKVSYNDIIAMAVCRALKDHPIMNSTLTDAGIVLGESVNLGIAVALDDGLVVPNIKAADTLSLMEMAVIIRELAQKARENRLAMDDIQGGTFTISNVSMLGVDGFTPILNPPETGILGVGRAVEKPAVHDGQVMVRTLMTLSLTFDHRVVDGVPAMRFLRTLADYLEDPVMIMA
jgi:pyruvate dehydrogenase E2 component (dihydrolipoamide acetyltransferase)